MVGVVVIVPAIAVAMRVAVTHRHVAAMALQLLAVAVVVAAAIGEVGATWCAGRAFKCVEAVAVPWSVHVAITILFVGIDGDHAGANTGIVKVTIVGVAARPKVEVQLLREGADGPVGALLVLAVVDCRAVTGNRDARHRWRAFSFNNRKALGLVRERESLTWPVIFIFILILINIIFAPLVDDEANNGDKNQENSYT